MFRAEPEARKTNEITLPRSALGAGGRWFKSIRPDFDSMI